MNEPRKKSSRVGVLVEWIAECRFFSQTKVTGNRADDWFPNKILRKAIMNKIFSWMMIITREAKNVSNKQISLPKKATSCLKDGKNVPKWHNHLVFISSVTEVKSASVTLGIRLYLCCGLLPRTSLANKRYLRTKACRTRKWV